MMIKYFGEVAEKAQKTSEKLDGEVRYPEQLKAWLVENYQLDMTGLKLAVNHNLVDWTSDLEITKNDEIAILSSFAGG